LWLWQSSKSEPFAVNEFAIEDVRQFVDDAHMGTRAIREPEVQKPITIAQVEQALSQLLNTFLLSFIHPFSPGVAAVSY
jgi:hypothetical protein